MRSGTGYSSGDTAERPSWQGHVAGLLALLLLSVPCSSAMGAGLTWDPAGNGSLSGGSGTWNAADVWWSGTQDTPWANGNNATFQGTGGTVTVTGPVAPTNLIFNSTGYTITGSTVTLGGTSGGTITVATGDTAYLSSVLAGSNVVVAGGGLLQLSASSTYTSSTTISSGTVQLGSPPAAGSAINLAFGGLTYTGSGPAGGAATQTWNISDSGGTDFSDLTTVTPLVTAAGATVFGTSFSSNPTINVYDNTVTSPLLSWGAVVAGARALTGNLYFFGFDRVSL